MPATTGAVPAIRVEVGTMPESVAPAPITGTASMKSARTGSRSVATPAFQSVTPSTGGPSAVAGSKMSLSAQRNTGLPPAISRTRAAVAGMRSASISFVGTRLQPGRRAPAKTPGTQAKPRGPTWTAAAR